MSQNEQGRVGSMIDGDAITKLAATVLGDNTTTSTTTFTNQNPTNVLKVASDSPHDSSLIRSATTGPVDQSLASFMAKPVPITTGSITSANLAGSQLFKFNIAPQLTSQLIWKNKIDGFMNFRGTAKVKLQINANPFQAGRLILAYIPQYAHASRSYTTHLFNLMTITQLPHVEMSFQDSECELEIPYISPTTHFNVLSGLYDWGTVFCYVYSPLTVGSGGTNQVTYTAWLSFDDFELQVPIVPQSGGRGNAKRDIIRKYRVNAIKSNIDSEVNEGKGPISSVLSNVSSIATTLYKVPFLAPIAGPTAWLSNVAAGVASAFGWSKPILDTAPCRMFNNPHAYIANTNAPDISNNLGLIADNKVSVMPDVNLSGVDEMSHAFIKRQKAWYKTVVWTTTTLPGPLSQDTINPSAFRSGIATRPVGATSLVNFRTYTPVAYLCEFYRYWRGSLEITIKIVKTQYHTGRLICSFAPDLTTGSITNLESDYVHREIIDLRDGSEFCVTIPYCYYAPYMCSDVSQNDIAMMFHVNVLNELVAPETCGQSVELLFEVRGGKDLEYQVPSNFNLSAAQVIEPQSGGDDQSVPVLCNNIGGSDENALFNEGASLCIGESSTSILQLLKRYQRLTTSTAVTTQNKIGIYPYLWGGFYSSGVALGGTQCGITGDALSAFAPCYAHSRGGVRIRAICDPVSEADPASGSFIGSLVPFSVASGSPYNLGTANVFETLGFNTHEQTGAAVFNQVTSFDGAYVSGTAVTVPMYNRTFARLNRIFFNNIAGVAGGTLVPLTSPDISIVYPQIVSTSTTFGTGTMFMRCASDDFQFSFWLGVPTMGYMTPS